MAAKLGELPRASVLVRATILGSGVIMTTACAHNIPPAPTCGPCCHGDPSGCYVEQAPVNSYEEQDEAADQSDPADADAVEQPNPPDGQPPADTPSQGDPHAQPQAG